MFGVASYIPAAELVPGVIGLLARDGLALLVCYRSKDLPRNRRLDVGVEEMPEIKTDVGDLESEFVRQLGNVKRLLRRVDPGDGNIVALEVFNRWM